MGFTTEINRKELDESDDYGNYKETSAQDLHYTYYLCNNMSPEDYICLMAKIDHISLLLKSLIMTAREGGVDMFEDAKKCLNGVIQNHIKVAERVLKETKMEQQKCN
jgi:hypothetical protein